jgi:hypothetical protein
MRQVLPSPPAVVARRFCFSALLVLALSPPLTADKSIQQGEPLVSLTTQEKEFFLLNAKVIKTRGASKGITGTLRATLSDGRITHDASIQSIDMYKAIQDTPIGPQVNFRDCYKFNIAAYRLAGLLGIDGVPPSVERRFGGRSAAFTWWVDDVLMDEGQRLNKKLEAPDGDAWNAQMFVVRVFDQLIDNIDRNVGNLLITKDWNIWMIDHTRAFRPISQIRVVRNLTKCDRSLLQRLKEITDQDLERELGDLLTNSEMKALLARRGLIIECFEKLGEAGLYDRTPRVATVSK